MTTKKQKTLSQPTRRRILQGAVALGLAPLFVSRDVFAQTQRQMERTSNMQKISKKQAHYQTKPHGPEACANCRWFIPPTDHKDMGRCRKVEGKISPHGWCHYYMPG